ncbi:MAG: hypothetical protein WCC57_19485, partial [Paracoccaceae bacterium]
RALAIRVGQKHRLTWDMDDAAIFDLPGTRVVLAVTELAATPALNRPFSVCLTVSVGVPPDAVDAPQHPRRDAWLCSTIADRVRDYYSANAILWHELQDCATPDLLDELAQKLPAFHTPPETTVETPCETHPGLPVHAGLPAIVPSQLPAIIAAANDQPDLPPTDQIRLTRIRDALYASDTDPDLPVRASTQIRIAAHAMNSTLILVSLPVGAALLTYSVLRGEDMRLSARAIALTGAVAGLMHSPFGQQMALMI